MSSESEAKTVQSETCRVCRDGIFDKVRAAETRITSVEEVGTKRLDSHAEEIKDLTKVSIEIAASQELLIKYVEAQNTRIKLLEDTIVSSKKWWDTDIGKWCIKAGCITLILIIAAAIGRPFLENFEKFAKILTN